MKPLTKVKRIISARISEIGQLKRLIATQDGKIAKDYAQMIVMRNTMKVQSNRRNKSEKIFHVNGNMERP